MRIDGNIVIYDDMNGQDEIRFLKWFDAHTAILDETLHAYIANVPRRSGGDPVYIHISPFSQLKGYQNYINRILYKVCSTDYAALRAWLAHNGYLDVHDVIV